MRKPESKICHQERWDSGKSITKVTNRQRWEPVHQSNLL